MYTLPDYANPIIRYAAFYLGKGKSLDAVRQMATTRHPGIAQQVIDESVSNAQELLAFKQNASMLLPSQPLSTILQGETPPGPTTYVNARVPFFPKGQQNNKSSWQWREVQWRGSWTDQWQYILAYLQGRADQIMQGFQSGFGVDYDIGELVIDSTIWFQHPQQL